MADRFVDLEDSEQLVLEVAHGELLRIARRAESPDPEKPGEVLGLSYFDVVKLGRIHAIVKDSKLLALRQFEIDRKYGETIPVEAVELSKQIGPVEGDKH
jgi:hypothetical protein